MLSPDAILQFAADWMRPVNIILSLVCLISVIMYASAFWSKLEICMKRILMVLALLMFTALFGSAEAYAMNVPGGWRTFLLTFGCLGLLRVIGHEAHDRWSNNKLYGDPFP